MGGLMAALSALRAAGWMAALPPVGGSLGGWLSMMISVALCDDIGGSL